MLLFIASLGFSPFHMAVGCGSLLERINCLFLVVSFPGCSGYQGFDSHPHTDNILFLEVLIIG